MPNRRATIASGAPRRHARGEPLRRHERAECDRLSADEFELYDDAAAPGDMSVRVYLRADIEPGFSDADAARFDAIRRVSATIRGSSPCAVKLYGRWRHRGVHRGDAGALRHTRHDRPAELHARRAEPHRGHDGSRGVADLHPRDRRPGVRMALDAFERAATANPAPARGRRHRIEHIETIDPADVPRFGALGVIASHAAVPRDADAEPDRACGPATSGPARAARGVGLRQHRQGGRPAGVRQRLARRVARSADRHPRRRQPARRLEGKPEGGWLPAERLPLARVIDAYTRDAAWAAFDEHRTGSLTPGLLADLVVIFAAENLFAAAARSTASTRSVRRMTHLSTDRSCCPREPPTTNRPDRATVAPHDEVMDHLTRYQERTPRSRELQQRARRVLPLGVESNFRFFDPYPIYIDRASGIADLGCGRQRVHRLRAGLRRAHGGARAPGRRARDRAAGGARADVRHAASRRWWSWPRCSTARHGST